ncbi:MAG: hypothetical protein ACXVB0_01370 [Mucilaginibacter sp.]
MMNPKYKPGIYFGISTFIFNLIILLVTYSKTFTGKNALLMIACSLVGGLIGGSLFGWMWNWLKNRQT